MGFVTLRDSETQRIRKIRFDTVASLQGALSAGTGDTSWTKVRSPIVHPASGERRREERFPAVSHRAWVGWRRWYGFRQLDAVIINISRGGALVFLDEPPALGRTVRLRVESSGLACELKGRVLEVTLTRFGQCVARLAFRHSPPLALFDVAVCGLPPIDPKRRMVLRPPDPPERPRG